MDRIVPAIFYCDIRTPYRMQLNYSREYLAQFGANLLYLARQSAHLPSPHGTVTKLYHIGRSTDLTGSDPRRVV